MSDLTTVITRLVVDSDIIRVLPNASYEIVYSGTATVVDSGTADAIGGISVTDLPTGHYDIKVAGDVYTSFHFVNTNKADRLCDLFIAGSFAADFAEDTDYPVWFPGVAGKIIGIELTVGQVTITSSGTLYILGATSPSGSQMTVPGNSKWNASMAPAQNAYRWRYGAVLDIDIAADEAFCVGFDYTAGTFTGLTLTLRFRPS